jgi:hypothetical protein
LAPTDSIDVKNASTKIVWHKKKEVSGSYGAEKKRGFSCICCVPPIVFHE